MSRHRRRRSPLHAVKELTNLLEEDMAAAVTTVDLRVADVLEAITPKERDAFAAYWNKMTKLDYVKAPVREVAATYGNVYARSMVMKNRRAVAQWAAWLEELHAALWIGGRPPSVEAWSQEHAEREHFDVVQLAVRRQTDMTGAAADTPSH